MTPPDPIAGQREAINEGTSDALLFPYFDPETSKVKPCPVKRGQEFELRACRITCGTPMRIGKHGAWQWRVPITRHQRVTKDKFRGLGRGLGYVEDPRAAVSAHDCPPDDDHWRDVDGNDGPPPEPEAIDPEDIINGATAVAQRARHEREQRERREAFEALPLSERVRRLELAGGRAARRQLRAIRSQVAEGEKRAGIDRAA